VYARCRCNAQTWLRLSLDVYERKPLTAGIAAAMGDNIANASEDLLPVMVWIHGGWA